MRNKIVSTAIEVLQKLAGLMLFAMVLVITIQLIGRNFLKTSTAWTEEVSRMLLVWMTFIGSPVALHKGEHLMVDLIYERLNPTWRRIIRVLTSVIIIAFCCFIIKLGVDLCANKVILNSTTAAANIPRVYIYAALPFGGVMLLLVAINQLIDGIMIMLGKMEDNVVGHIIDEDMTLDEIEGGDQG